MPKNPPAVPAVARLRFRGIVTTMLVIALSVLIVRDIIIRRWGSATPPSSDVTRRLP
jgi:hypothetical protein